VSEHILFLTGQLAERQLIRVLEDLAPSEFTWQVHPLGLKVAALMTADMIRRRLTDTRGADRILVPGRCRGDMAALGEHFGIPVERGPEELMDLPRYFGREGRPPDLSQYEVRIFAELVDAPRLGLDAILERAAAYQADGADVIDLGCLPDTPFPHLEEAVRALKAGGHLVSVDSMQPEELLSGGRAGADFLLSLSETSLWIADETDAIPVLIPETPGDLDSLERAMARMAERGRSFIADSVLDPIHFGFADSLARYHRLRQTHPAVAIMMGTGNLTELTEADTTGINALLMGLISELHIGNILTTQVSPHCRTAIREADRARRIMYWAREQNSLPKQIDGGLSGLHELKPFPYGIDAIREFAAEIRDPNFRIQVSDEGIHLYNREGLMTFEDPFDFFPHLKVEQDGSHAFYLGVELARAQIARQLGKRYVQDQPLRWGCIVPEPVTDTETYQAPGTTLRHRRKGT
jgi:dihydropteroate synthase-like protein